MRNERDDDHHHVISLLVPIPIYYIGIIIDHQKKGCRRTAHEYTIPWDCKELFILVGVAFLRGTS